MSNLLNVEVGDVKKTFLSVFSFVCQTGSQDVVSSCASQNNFLEIINKQNTVKNNCPLFLSFLHISHTELTAFNIQLLLPYLVVLQAPALW